MILFNNSGVPFARKIQDSITVEVPAIYNEDGTLNETSTTTALQTALGTGATLAGVYRAFS